MLEELANTFNRISQKGESININYWGFIPSMPRMTAEIWEAQHKDPNDPWDCCPSYELQGLKVYEIKITDEKKVEAYAAPIEKGGKVLEDMKDWFKLSDMKTGELYGRSHPLPE